MNQNTDVTKLCRLCLEEDKVNIEIFDKDGKEKRITKKIFRCIPNLIVKPGDEYPQNICISCFKVLGLFYQFQKKCFNSKAKFDKLTGKPRKSTQMKVKSTKAGAYEIVDKKPSLSDNLVEIQEMKQEQKIHKLEIDDEEINLPKNGQNQEIEFGSSSKSESNWESLEQNIDQPRKPIENNDKSIIVYETIDGNPILLEKTVGIQESMQGQKTQKWAIDGEEINLPKKRQKQEIASSSSSNSKSILGYLKINIEVKGSKNQKAKPSFKLTKRSNLCPTLESRDSEPCTISFADYISSIEAATPKIRTRRDLNNMSQNWIGYSDHENIFSPHANNVSIESVDLYRRPSSNGNIGDLHLSASNNRNSWNLPDLVNEAKFIE